MNAGRPAPSAARTAWRVRRDREFRSRCGGRPVGDRWRVAAPSDTSVAQLVEHRSPKPAVGGSIPSARAVGEARPEACEHRVRWLTLASGYRGGAPTARHPRCRAAESGLHEPDGSTEPPGVSPAKQRDRCHGQSQRRSVGVEAVEARQGEAAAARRGHSSPLFLPTWLADRSLQADAGVVCPALHGARAGRDRRRRRLAGLRVVDRVHAALAVRAPGGLRAGPGLDHLPDRPFPAVRRVPDRHRGRDEQGLVDQQGRPLSARPSVVLTTVVLMAVFLFVVDWLWPFILRIIGVLQFTGGGGFGSTA